LKQDLTKNKAEHLLHHWIQTISEVMLWVDSEKEYKHHYFMYALSKSLKYQYMDKRIVGDVFFYTQSPSSNKYLIFLLNSIKQEINGIFENGASNDGITERRLIALQFLSRLGNCENYTEFILLLNGRPISDSSLDAEIKILRDGLFIESLIPEMHEQIESYRSSIELFFNDDIENKWTRAKLYAYCILFNFLMSYELYNMYDSWYEKKEKLANRNKIQKRVQNIINMINETEKYYINYLILKNKLLNTIICAQVDKCILKDIMKELDRRIKKSADPLMKEDLLSSKNNIKLTLIYIY
jgi:hypothetical protein